MECVFVRATILLAMSSSMLAGQATRIASAPSCPKCTIELRHVATLGEEDGQISDYPPSVARSRDGTIYVIDQKERMPHAFSAGGRFLGALGRRGAGPGEYQSASIVMVGLDNRVHVLDGALSRRTILSPSRELLTSVPGPSGAPGVGNAILLPNNHVITNGLMVDAEGVGRTLQEWDERGTRIKVFGDEEVFRRDRNTYHLARVIAARPNGDVWSVKPYQYVIQLFGADRSKKKEFVRIADWYKPLVPGAVPSSGRREAPPSPTVRGVWEDTKGLLWTTTLIASRSWKPGPTSEELKRGAPALPTQSPYSTMIEVIDPAAGKVVTSLRVDLMIVHVLLDGHVASYRETADGTPLVDVWQVQLKRIN
jgi:hypothetical protein